MQRLPKRIQNLTASAFRPTLTEQQLAYFSSLGTFETHLRELTKNAPNYHAALASVDHAIKNRSNLSDADNKELRTFFEKQLNDHFFPYRYKSI